LAERIAAAVAAHDLTAVGVDLAGVELAALFRIAQQIEGPAEALEALLGGLVALVGVGVVLLGQLAERLADLVRARATLHTQFLIGILRQSTVLQGSGKSTHDLG